MSCVKKFWTNNEKKPRQFNIIHRNIPFHRICILQAYRKKKQSHIIGKTMKDREKIYFLNSN